ncbi:MAG TPA: hypothetical protein VKB35_18345, partial [Ktedonobacteraceae bacterium]|nr:hypothetical protein [Ktedonobacteraceae bacterium]
VEKGIFKMVLSHQSNQQRSADPAYRKFHHVFFALCMLLAPLTVSLWFGLCPEYGNPACPVGTGATLTAFRADDPLLLQLFFVVAFISAYIYPLSYIGLGRLAMKRSPWLSSIGIALGFIGSVVWSLLMGESFWVNSAAHLHVDAQFFMLGKAYVANWAVFAMHGGWIIGHLLGYVLLGIALLRARVIPRWAAWLLVVSPVLMGPLAYGTGLGLLQVLGYGMVFVGSIPAAVAMLKWRKEDK